MLFIQSCLTLCLPMDCSTPSFPVHSPSPGVCPNSSIDSVMPSNHLILSPTSPPAYNLSQHQGLSQWVGCSHEMAKVLEASTSAPVLPINIQDWFPLGLVKETLKSLLQHHSSSENISSLLLSLLFSLTITSTHNYWKNHRSEYTDLCIVCHCFWVFPIYLGWNDGLDAVILDFWMLSQLFHSPLSPSSKSSLVPLCFLP